LFRQLLDADDCRALGQLVVLVLALAISFIALAAVAGLAVAVFEKVSAL
jgi:hypothetical protein